MRKEVEEGEQNREGFLDTPEALERPFAVKLHHIITTGKAGLGYYMLAGVVAFGGTVPEEDAMMQS